MFFINLFSLSFTVWEKIYSKKKKKKESRKNANSAQNTPEFRFISRTFILSGGRANH